MSLSGLRRLAPLTQILFGSDWPFTPEMGVARAIHQLVNDNGLPDNDLAAIARKNAERLFPRLAQ
jgi:predicted TIM-barrel fold metal-dependent hydrolase